LVPKEYGQNPPSIPTYALWTLLLKILRLFLYFLFKLTHTLYHSLDRRENKMTVFVVQEPDASKNILSAMDFGDIEVVLPARENMMYSPAPTVARIKHALRNFTDEDYLLLIGDPAAIGVAVHIALQNNRQKVKLLKWDKREYRYYPVEVEI